MNGRPLFGCAREPANVRKWVLLSHFSNALQTPYLLLCEHAYGGQDEASAYQLPLITPLKDRCRHTSCAASHNDRVRGSRVVGLVLLTAGKEHRLGLDF